MRTQSLAVIASVAASLMAASALADATYTWTTKDIAGGSPYTTSGGGPGNQYTFTSGSETVKVRAYSLAGVTASSIFETATVNLWGGGLGMASAGDAGSPSHAVDKSGRFDFLLFEVESADSKNSGFQIGWDSADSDMEVWAVGLTLTGSGLCSGSCSYADLDDVASARRRRPITSR